jgi:hypothetical protein
MSAKSPNNKRAPEVHRFWISSSSSIGRGEYKSFVSLREYEELLYKYETLKTKYKQ